MNKIDLDKAIYLIEKIDPKERPSWVSNLLEELSKIIELPNIYKKVVKISLIPESWHEGKELFTEIRKLTLKSKSDIDEGILCLLENSAKTIYNASEANGPFDYDSTAWILLNLNFIAEEIEIEEFRNFYESTISELQIKYKNS